VTKDRADVGGESQDYLPRSQNGWIQPRPVPITAFHPTPALPPGVPVTDFVPQMSPPPPLLDQSESKPTDLDRIRNIEMVELPLPFIPVRQNSIPEQRPPPIAPFPFPVLPNSFAANPDPTDTPDPTEQDPGIDDIAVPVNDIPDPSPPLIQPPSKMIVLQLLARRKAECS
jgi:hypothetical protein